jgi:hypothetical protein
MHIIGYKVRINLMGMDKQERENHPETIKIGRLWGYMLEEGVTHEEFLNLAKRFDKEHRYPNWTIADFLEPRGDYSPDDLFPYSDYEDLVHKKPNTKIEAYNVNGVCMYRIADGKEVPLQKWDDYLKTKKPPKKPEKPVKQESTDEFNARMAMENVTNKVRISKMTEENERFRKKIEQDKVHIQKLREKIDRLQKVYK